MKRSLLYTGAAVAVASAAWYFWRNSQAEPPSSTNVGDATKTNQSESKLSEDKGLVFVKKEEGTKLPTNKTFAELITRPTPSSDLNSTPEHFKELPNCFAAQIPIEEKLILAFVRRFLDSHKFKSVNVLINGGYVRDLLRGEDADDLDLSLCLRQCGPGMCMHEHLATVY